MYLLYLHIIQCSCYPTHTTFNDIQYYCDTIAIMDMFPYYRDSVQIDNLTIGVNDFDECE